MTPDERDRLRALEVKYDSLDDWLRSIDGKVDELRTAAHMGKGAWWLMLRVGAVMAVLAGAVAWGIDHLPRKHP